MLKVRQMKFDVGAFAKFLKTHVGEPCCSMKELKMKNVRSLKEEDGKMIKEKV